MRKKLKYLYYWYSYSFDYQMKAVLINQYVFNQGVNTYIHKYAFTSSTSN